jgi:S-methylmethionine-dependent homocysteine/selenocysteine methylase
MGLESRKWISTGAKIIGGCCGTSPQHLKAIISNIHSVINH